MSPRPPISIIVPTGNRADVIEDCLLNVRWAEEVLVVDSFSTDGTLDIAKKYADRVLQHEYGFSAQQKNWAIPQATHQWVMIVDTDERISPQLRVEIERILDSSSSFAGYRIPRINYLLGRSLNHAGYYPDYQIRLFQRDLSRYETRRVHAHILLDGDCGTLEAPIIHYAHRSIDQTLRNLLIQMTTWEAEQRMLNSQKLGKRSKKRLYIDLLLRPMAAFGLRYLKQGGWRDGSHGLVISMIWSFYVAITYMKMWEQQLDLPQRWWANDWHLSHEESNEIRP